MKHTSFLLLISFSFIIANSASFAAYSQKTDSIQILFDETQLILPGGKSEKKGYREADGFYGSGGITGVVGEAGEINIEQKGDLSLLLK